MTLFVDTSALYALLVRTEEDHAAVAAAFSEALQSGRLLVTTNYALVETAALLQHRIGLGAVRDLDARIVPLLRIHWIEEALHRRAVARLFRTDRRRVSLVDCASFELMEAEEIPAALALDSDFKDQGFELIP